MSEQPPILRKAPLRVVAIELRFPDTVLLPEDLKKIRKALAADYPASDNEQGFGVEISLQAGVKQHAGFTRHTYKSRDGSHQVGLTSTALVLEARANYEGFKHFLERWQTVLGIVEPALDLDTQIRLGLRYVNQLVVEDPTTGLESVSGRINPALLSPLSADGFEHAVTNSFQELRLQSERSKGTLRHGLQVAQEESPVPGVYVLDLDFYDDELTGYDNEAQKEKLKLFNTEIWKIFRWSLTDDEFARMEPEERDDTAR